MSKRIKLLTAAVLLAFPLAAGAQEVAAEADIDAEAAAEPDVDAAATTAAEAEPAADSAAEADADAAAQAGPVTPATAADVRAGVAVLDPEGGPVGTVESVDAEGAVVDTGNIRAKLPIASFGRSARGLVISMTRAELEAAVSARTPS